MLEFRSVCIGKSNVFGTLIQKCRNHMKTNDFHTLEIAFRKHLFYQWKWSRIIENPRIPLRLYWEIKRFRDVDFKVQKPYENKWFSHFGNRVQKTLVLPMEMKQNYREILESRSVYIGKSNVVGTWNSKFRKPIETNGFPPSGGAFWGPLLGIFFVWREKSPEPRSLN